MQSSPAESLLNNLNNRRLKPLTSNKKENYDKRNESNLQTSTNVFLFLSFFLFFFPICFFLTFFLSVFFFSYRLLFVHIFLQSLEKNYFRFRL